MLGKRTRFALLLTALPLNLVGIVQAQDSVSSELTSTIALIEQQEPGSKNSITDDESNPTYQNWLFHVQGTEVAQGQPGFHSPYQGTNSLRSNDTFRQTSSIDIYLGAHLWPGGEIYFNPEYYQGFGLSDTHGIAAFPNSEAYKIGQKIGDIFNAHLFLRQTFGLGGEQEEISGDLLQLAEMVDISRLTFTIGRVSVGDQFDTNAYAHSGRTQFLNWMLNDNGAFDYAADSLGVIEGATVELNQKTWAFRYGIFDVPRVSNGLAKDGHFLKAWQQALEFEQRYSMGEHPGKVRLLGWLEHAHMGSYRETLADPSLMEDITLTRRYRYQYGFGLSAEQEITKDLGMFVRASWRDGQEEVWQFTDVDRSLSMGLQLKGAAWRRTNDTVGLAGIVDGLSQAHRDYLAAGGLGILLGDGKLPNYSPESVLEMYYDVEVIRNFHLAIDYQLIGNPGYNADRGPVNVFSSRFHFQF